MIKSLVAGLAVLAVLFVGACAPTGEVGNTAVEESRKEQAVAVAGIVLQLATARYFTANPDQAEAAVLITDNLIEMVEADDVQTVSDLQAAAVIAIPWDVLTPQEKAALTSLLRIVVAEFRIQLEGNEVFADENKARALRILYAINAAAGGGETA